MSIEVLFQFTGGARGVVVLDYNQFGHASKGQWSTMCPLVGRGGEGLPEPVPGRPIGSGGNFEIVGGVCSMYERDESGGNALAAEMRYFPKLGGISDEELRAGKFEGPFRIYRASVMEAAIGDWKILGLAGICMSYDWSLTQHQ